MGRYRRSTTYSYHRRAPYNLRKRTKTVDYSKYFFPDGHSSNKEKIEKTHENGDLPDKTSFTPTLLKVSSIDMHVSENAKAHHTEKYEMDHLVIRRGQSFSLSLTFDRPLEDADKAIFMLMTGKNPLPSKGTVLSFTLTSKEYSAFGWTMKKTLSDDNKMYNLEITPYCEAPIGLYEMMIQIGNPLKTKAERLSNKFYLIFNPWLKADDVYMEDEKTRHEYVLNETGRIWVGSKNKFYGKPWIYGQFEMCSLSAALHILKLSDLSDHSLGNPVLVARVFSKMSNSFDDDGILTGNWSGDYTGGTEPTDWISSVDILTEYMRTGTEVKYGQCWVFSGILTTLFRAVGIPARSVTNFESAHDTDSSMTIDRHWDYEDKPLPDLNDSIWNFHVWNEVWFKRNDLPDDNDGWQVVDGTPQECSEGVMQCGPASVNAIKLGEVFYPYDAKFVIAEVNGDIIEWVKDREGLMTPVWKESRAVGCFISTKAVGSDEREDITHQYKYEEGSIEEEKVVARLAKFSSRKDQLLPFYKQDVKDTVTFHLSGTGYQSGDVKIKLAMNSAEDREVTIDITLTCLATYYNGTTGDELSTTTKLIKLAPKAKQTVEITLEGEDYLNKIATDATVGVFCKAMVSETGQRFYTRETFAIDRPDVVVNCPRTVKINEQFPVDVVFKHELSTELTDCRLIIEGPGIEPVRSVKMHTSTIKPNSTFTQTFTLKAFSAGSKEIIAQLHTRQLQNVTGSASIEVNE